MKIGGLLRTSLIDYPGLISAVIFTQGCNFRCPYCHNPELVDLTDHTIDFSEEEIFSFLERRKNLLDGVVITGGEPTLHKDLPRYLAKYKKLGYRIKLDTNGTDPDVIKILLDEQLVDYIAMDLKAPFDKYPSVTGVNFDLEKVKATVTLISKATIDIEFRTTVVENLHSEEDIIKISNMVPVGRRFVIQRFEPTETLDKEYKNRRTISDLSMAKIQERFKQETINYAIR